MTISSPPCFTRFYGMPMDVVNEIRAGIPVTIVDEVAEFMELRLEMLADFLRFSRLELVTRIQAGGTLLPWESGRLYWVAHAFKEAARVFESEQCAVEWLRGRVMALGNIPPLSLLDSPAGYQLVLNTIGQIEHGVCA
ncbi:DUF2384 domain-containing protein [Massilia sp. P8910]|uniref:antitoxin Xre/MbcA/ParS toxin-binding domain-containing protein n=1 Tax=Massilia antarctica TaxID=2765360 RepID=UPI001E5505A8|nr:antitoxin Xre/MbcA/ParS toxin-binding domain-containing protein [Massilia antarctica]MCE3602814.1 DUF2384 domain-containing protein [Massilia antarctica]